MGRRRLPRPRPAVSQRNLTLPLGGGCSVQPEVNERTATDVGGDTASRRRAIGVVGTAARVIIGLVLLASVFWGELRTGGVEWSSLVLGLGGFPAVVVAWQWQRSRRNPTPLRATGPLGFAFNIAVFAALYLTPLYVPALSFTSDATLVYYGTSMLLAALRSYAACEVLAVSNWLLRRDDQVGCMVFAPVDYLERRLLVYRPRNPMA